MKRVRNLSLLFGAFFLAAALVAGTRQTPPSGATVTKQAPATEVASATPEPTATPLSPEFFQARDAVLYKKMATTFPSFSPEKCGKIFVISVPGGETSAFCTHKNFTQKTPEGGFPPEWAGSTFLLEQEIEKEMK